MRPKRSNAISAVFVTLLALSACKDKVTDPPPPPPVPTTDLSGYFIVPDTGYQKFYVGGSTQTWVKDSVIDGDAVAVVQQSSGSIDYFDRSTRAWVAWFNAGFVQNVPPLAAIPEHMPVTGNHVANSSFDNTLLIRRISRLIDTMRTDTVPAGVFDRVVLIRQEFLRFTQFGTLTDSAYRWFAPGVDEIRQIRWSDGDTVATTREFAGGTINGQSYP